MRLYQAKRRKSDHPSRKFPPVILLKNTVRSFCGICLLKKISEKMIFPLDKMLALLYYILRIFSWREFHPPKNHDHHVEGG